MALNRCGVHVFIYLVCDNFCVLSRVSKSICDNPVGVRSKTNGILTTEVEELKYTFVLCNSGVTTFNPCTKKDNPNALIVSVITQTGKKFWIL
jgi:hypothetical protein